MKGRVVFVTGTDTGVGKTFVSTLVLQELRARGIKVGAMKPVETGCEKGPHGLIPADAEKLRLAAGGEQGLDEVNLYRFAVPVAPIVASRLEERELHREILLGGVKRAKEKVDLLLVEGAGGLLVPILEGYSYRDFAREIGAEVILVVGSKLGCLNHALLTLEALRVAQIPVLGYVLNECFRGQEGSVEAVQTNRETLQLLSRTYEVPEVGFVPAAQSGEPHALESLLQRLT